MSQPPGYGWFVNSPGQARFPGPPPPPAPAYNPVGQAYYPGVSQSSQPDVNSTIGWQQGPPLAPDLGFGGFNSAPMATGAAVGGYGFGFGAPPTSSSMGPAAPSAYTPTYPEPSAPQPSAPSAPENRSSHPSEDSREPTNSGPRFVNITSDSKPARPPPPEIVPATNSTPKPNPSKYSSRKF